LDARGLFSRNVLSADTLSNELPCNIPGLFPP
jgi:hypothetical protein